MAFALLETVNREGRLRRNAIDHVASTDHNGPNPALSCEVKKGYKVIDIDTHVNPSYDTLAKYVDPTFVPDWKS